MKMFCQREQCDRLVVFEDVIRDLHDLRVLNAQRGQVMHGLPVVLADINHDGLKQQKHQPFGERRLFDLLAIDGKQGIKDKGVLPDLKTNGIYQVG